MKKLIYLILFLLCSVAYIGCNDDKGYDLNRPASPTECTASKGDTSVFLKWKKMDDAPYYMVVRGMKVIADSLTTDFYEDPYAPDTMVEYRIYAKNAAGWRSYTYAADSGYAVPGEYLPRAPITLKATSNNYEGCKLEWTGGRFANSFTIYRGEELIAKDVKEYSFVDYNSSVSKESTYSVYSVNQNGASEKAISAKGKKAYYFIDSYEDLAVGSVIEPWTFRADRIGYYTEGNPTVTAEETFEGSKSLKIISGKIQMLCDWGGTLTKGYYKISLMTKKADGGFWMAPDFSDAKHHNASSDWSRFEIETAFLEVGTKFNIKVEPYGNAPAYIDNFAIEYISPKTLVP